ncbi:MAG: hypothetical protein QXK37_04575 [Candidatus Woesearchaeota archaeon]
MAEVSNKTIAILLVGAIIVSLTGTLISLNKISQIRPLQPLRGPPQITGMLWQENGSVTVQIQSGASLRVARNIDFGQISPNSTGPISISSDIDLNGRGGTYDCSIVANCSGLEIENDGNTWINVTMNSTWGAEQLIGGASPAIYFYVASGNSSSTRGEQGCSNTIYGSGWTPFVANTSYVICNGSSENQGLNYTDSPKSDKLTVEFNLTIPSDATVGARTAYIAFYNEP